MIYKFYLRKNTNKKTLLKKISKKKLTLINYFNFFEKFFEIPSKMDEDDSINLGEFFDMTMKLAERKINKKDED